MPTVLITGTSGGIGAATAERLTADGYRVLRVARTPQDADYVADLADVDALAAVATAVRRDVSQLDALIHNAADYRRGTVATAPLEDFDGQLAVNLRAPFRLTQALLPLLIAVRGSVIFVNSSAAFSAPAELSAYSASKAGLKALADSLRAEVNDSGVRVCSIFLGRAATRMQARASAAAGAPYSPERLLQPQDIAASIAHVLALPDTAEITDLHLRPRYKR
jgi:NAD(P)-dependent dehydrogenase (short-subunit alcohol dehydrogenase family)